MELVSARPTPYSSCERGSGVCFPSSSSIVSFHIETGVPETVPHREGLLYRASPREGNVARGAAALVVAPPTSPTVPACISWGDAQAARRPGRRRGSARQGAALRAEPRQSGGGSTI